MERTFRRWLAGSAAACLLLAGLYASSLYSYLLFHSLVEIFSIFVALLIFVLAWHTRSLQDNRYLLFIGIASLFTAILELIHMLAYKGMAIFPGYSADLPTQLWIAFRYLFSLSLLLAPVFIKRDLHAGRTLAVYSVITAGLIYSIFSGRFPACFIEGSGLTPFKIVSEYVISAIFLASLGFMAVRREAFDRRIFGSMAAVIIASVASEVSFTRYASVFGPANMVGHIFLLASMVILYRAIVITCLVEPSSLLFRELKMREEELGRHREQLEAANRELEAFSYSVSHDLRAPLRSIDGFSRILWEDHAGRLGDEGVDTLKRIVAAARRMGQLIDDMLKLSRISRSEMLRTDVDLSSVAAQVADSLAKLNPGREVQFIIGKDCHVSGDEQLLTIALENLFSNALKFTAKRTPAVIEFGRCQGKGTAAYFVKDNGAGFEMAYVDKLFNPFQRLHREADFPGTGIGLATVKRIIGRHGGVVWIEGAVDKGAVVYFTLG